MQQGAAMAVAPGLPCLPTAIRVPTPLGSIRKIAAAPASPICPALHTGHRPVSPFGNCTFGQGLLHLSHSRIRSKNRPVGSRELAVPQRFGIFDPKFEFRGGLGTKACVPARAAAGVGGVGGSWGFLKWVEALDGSGLKDFFLLVQNIVSRREKRTVQSAPWLAVVIGSLAGTLAGILAFRFAVPVFAAICLAIVASAFLFGLRVYDGKLHLGCDWLEVVKMKTIDQQLNCSESISEGTEETVQIAPFTCETRSIPSVASDGTTVEETLVSEVVKDVAGMGPSVDSFIGMNNSADVHGSHLADVQEYSCFTNSLGEDKGSVSKQLSRINITQGMEVERARLRSPDPWQNDCKTGPVEQDALARGNWAARPSLSRRSDDGSHFLDLSLIADDLSNTKIDKEDGIWSGRVSTYGSLDFWGKNSGASIMASEQRGTLIKSMAASRGVGFGSVDDLEDCQPQDQGRRPSEKEQRQMGDVLSSSRASQPWDGKYQAGAFGREALPDDTRMWRDPDSALAGDDLGRREIFVGKVGPISNMETRGEEEMSQPRRPTSSEGDVPDRASVGGRVSFQNLIDTRILDNDPLKSRQGEEPSNKQSADEAGDVRERNLPGSKRSRGGPLNSEKTAGPEGGQQNGRGRADPSVHSQSQAEVIENNIGLQQPKEAPTPKFGKYLDEADALLEQGMQGLEGRIEVGVAERMLYEAADLLEKASEAYPADLVVVGQWGNTLLVHGQLKLKLSQQLRSMLPSPTPSSALMKREREIAELERESMELTLQEVCEECEELLVDAGRKFRKALSLDKTDVRALYNWALALCYRGQLISEEGGERAMQDADRVYLAAIDKFEAMLGISQDYVPGALLNWGVAVRDRSRLRDMGDKERVQLLLQAKELLQDAVQLDPSNGDARGALAVCCAELKELQAFEGLERQGTVKDPNRNWRQRRG